MTSDEGTPHYNSLRRQALCLLWNTRIAGISLDSRVRAQGLMPLPQTLIPRRAPSVSMGCRNPMRALSGLGSLGFGLRASAPRARVGPAPLGPAQAWRGGPSESRMHCKEAPLPPARLAADSPGGPTSCHCIDFLVSRWCVGPPLWGHVQPIGFRSGRSAKPCN